VATKEIERDIGEIKGVLDGAKDEISNIHLDQSNIFERLRKVEQEKSALQEQINSIGAEVERRGSRISSLERSVAVNQEQITNMGKRIDKMCEEKEQEKEDERSATNTKLTVVGIVLAAIEMIIGIVLAATHM